MLQQEEKKQQEQLQSVANTTPMLSPHSSLPLHLASPLSTPAATIPSPPPSHLTANSFLGLAHINVEAKQERGERNHTSAATAAGGRRKPADSSSAAAVASLEDDASSLSPLPLTPQEMKQERSHERSRRRVALKRKSDKKFMQQQMQGTGASPMVASPISSVSSPINYSLPSSPMPELMQDHPSSPTAAAPQSASAIAAAASSPAAPSLAVASWMRTRPTAAAASAVASPAANGSSLAFSHHTAAELQQEYNQSISPIMLSNAANSRPPRQIKVQATSGAATGAATATPSSRRNASPSGTSTSSLLEPQHRLLDIPDQPEDERTWCERRNDHCWNAIRKWDNNMQKKMVARMATINAIMGLGFLITVASTMSTTFADPVVHWFALLLSVVTLLLSWLLQHAAKQLDSFLLLLWLVFSGVIMAALIILAVFALAVNSGSLSSHIRSDWDANNHGLPLARESTAEFQAYFGATFGAARTHLLLLGSIAIAVATVLMAMVCIVATLRSEIVRVANYQRETALRQEQYQQRLQSRQRMARISARMKERRKLRKIRGRLPSASSPFAGSHLSASISSASPSSSSFSFPSSSISASSLAQQQYDEHHQLLQQHQQHHGGSSSEHSLRDGAILIEMNNLLPPPSSSLLLAQGLQPLQRVTSPLVDPSFVNLHHHHHHHHRHDSASTASMPASASSSSSVASPLLNDGLPALEYQQRYAEMASEEIEEELERAERKEEERKNKILLEQQQQRRGNHKSLQQQQQQNNSTASDMTEEEEKRPK